MSTLAFIAKPPQLLQQQNHKQSARSDINPVFVIAYQRIERAVHGTSQQLTLGLLQRELASLKNNVVMEENTLIWCSMVDKLREIERSD